MHTCVHVHISNILQFMNIPLTLNLHYSCILVDLTDLPAPVRDVGCSRKYLYFLRPSGCCQTASGRLIPHAFKIQIQLRTTAVKRFQPPAVSLNINWARRYLAVPMVCCLSQCVPVADCGGKADQQFVWDDLVVNIMWLCLSTFCWDFKIQFCH